MCLCAWAGDGLRLEFSFFFPMNVKEGAENTLNRERARIREDHLWQVRPRFSTPVSTLQIPGGSTGGGGGW